MSRGQNVRDFLLEQAETRSKNQLLLAQIGIENKFAPLALKGAEEDDRQEGEKQKLAGDVLNQRKRDQGEKGQQNQPPVVPQGKLPAGNAAPRPDSSATLNAEGIFNVVSGGGAVQKQQTGDVNPDTGQVAQPGTPGFESATRRSTTTQNANLGGGNAGIILNLGARLLGVRDVRTTETTETVKDSEAINAFSETLARAAADFEKNPTVENADTLRNIKDSARKHVGPFAPVAVNKAFNLFRANKAASADARRADSIAYAQWGAKNGISAPRTRAIAKAALNGDDETIINTLADIGGNRRSAQIEKDRVDLLAAEEKRTFARNQETRAAQKHGVDFATSVNVFNQKYNSLANAIGQPTYGGDMTAATLATTQQKLFKDKDGKSTPWVTEEGRVGLSRYQGEVLAQSRHVVFAYPEGGVLERGARAASSFLGGTSGKPAMLSFDGPQTLDDLVNFYFTNPLRDGVPATPDQVARAQRLSAQGVWNVEIIPGKEGAGPRIATDSDNPLLQDNMNIVFTTNLMRGAQQLAQEQEKFGPSVGPDKGMTSAPPAGHTPTSAEGVQKQKEAALSPAEKGELFGAGMRQQMNKGLDALPQGAKEGVAAVMQATTGAAQSVGQGAAKAVNAPGVAGAVKGFFGQGQSRRTPGAP